MMNRYRLAAVSNYKLAQLTFSTLDNGSLQKTALVKNLVTQLYGTNEDWTNEMTRWDFFTPESLENMTQRDIERIIQRYTQVIRNQSPIQVNDRTTSFYYPQLKQPLTEEEDSDDEIQEEEEEEGEIEEVIYYYSPPPSPPLSRYEQDDNDDNRVIKTGTTAATLTKNLAAELMSLFDMEFCLDLSLPNYRRSNSFDEPRYPSQVVIEYLPKRASSLEYRKSRSSEPSLIDDDGDDDEERSDSDSFETIELELEVTSRSSSVFSELFTSFTQTKNKRQKSIKRFFSSFSKVSQQEEEEEEESEERERQQSLVKSQSILINQQQQQQQQPKLTRSKSVGTKFLKRIKSFKKV